MKNDFILSNADISGTHLLSEIRCSPESLLLKFPDLKRSVIKSMMDETKKYSKHSIIIVPKSDNNEIYTITSCFGILRIGGFKEGINFQRLKEFLEN